MKEDNLKPRKTNIGKQTQQINNDEQNPDEQFVSDQRTQSTGNKVGSNVTSEKKTLKGDHSQSSQKNQEKSPATAINYCTCGYPNPPNTKFCINCGKAIKSGELPKEEEKVSPMLTQSAKPIIENKPPEIFFRAYPYDEDSRLIKMNNDTSHHNLTRDLLGPCNTKLSEKHAEIFYHQGNWILKDSSTHKETYIQISKCTLQNNDELLLGNSFYRFTVNSDYFDNNSQDNQEEEKIEDIDFDKIRKLKAKKTQIAKANIEEIPPVFFLQPLASKKEKSIPFYDDEEPFMLTREKLDPKNKTLSVKHAEIRLINNEFFFIDHSENKESFLRASLCELENGVELLFGNRFFKCIIKQKH